MGFVLDMVAGDITSNESTQHQKTLKTETSGEYSSVEYQEELTHVSNCPSSSDSKVDNLFPEQLVNIDIDCFLDEIV